MQPSMSAPRQVPRLKQVQFSESIVDEVVHLAGGQRISEMILRIPEGTENCDYLIGDHLLELKIIEIEPLEIQNHQEKLTRLITELASDEKNNATTSRQIHLKGKDNQSYWRIVGTTIRRRLEKAASQIRDTRILLKRPNLRGAAFLINNGADSIDSNSFWRLARRHRRDFSADINAVMCFSAIPGIAQGFNRLCVTFDHEHSGHEADKAFVKLFQASFSSVFANKIGKKPDEIISNDTIIQPFHTPFEIDTPQGKIVINSKKPE
jgi:hypothetical protein